MKDRSHDDAMVELFRDDPAAAAATLNAILADGDQGELLVTLRQMGVRTRFGKNRTLLWLKAVKPTCEFLFRRVFFLELIHK